MLRTPRQSPWSDNYWRDWLMYHGGFFGAGVVCVALGLLFGGAIAVLGGLLMFVAVTAGILNYLCDRDF